MVQRNLKTAHMNQSRVFSCLRSSIKLCWKIWFMHSSILL